MKEKLIVALDVPSLRDAEVLVKQLAGIVPTFKVGKELFTAEGPEVVRMIHGYNAQVFLDLKYHDIPTTVARAVTAAAGLGVFMLNLHAMGGSKMMLAASEAISNLEHQPILLGVTVLTSMGQSDLHELNISKAVDQQVATLALLAIESGLNGVVASGHEAEMIRDACGKDFVIVTPGVRPKDANRHDQTRVLTPQEAINNGASYIVIGRPITQAPNPADAAQEIIND
ncbi:MAG: orotidine-5'-phosphate decarboxylase [Candidatus Omnitrophota bacterium]|jgi:orotidine-5'-phosphate decarboxylase